jgi:hypothetical protein
VAIGCSCFLALIKGGDSGRNGAASRKAGGVPSRDG